MKVIVLLAFLVAVAQCAFTYFTDPAMVYPTVQGWYKGRRTFYYDFGPRSPVDSSGSTVFSCPLYALVYGFDAQGNPKLVPGQHNIAPALPGDGSDTYSDLWQIMFLQVPADYVANSVTDADVAIAMFSNHTKGPLVNCPVVPIGSSLEGKEYPITLGWYKNQTINYIDFGLTVSFTIPIYIVENSVGQHNIVGAIPADKSYSPYWQKYLYTAPATYKANTARDVASISKLGTYKTGPVVNCPIVKTEDKVYVDPSEDMTNDMESSPSFATQMVPSAIMFASVILALFF